MTALTSYSEKLAPYTPQSLAPTVQQVVDSDPHFTFFGVDPRSELSQLNERYHTFFDTIKDSAIGKQLAKYADEAISGRAGAPVMVVPAAAGAAGHGISRIQALSLSVILRSILTLQSDYTSVFNTLTQARNEPGFPQVASLFMLTAKDPSMKHKSPFAVNFDVIGATFIASMRPMLIHSNRARMTACMYYMRDENQAENVFLGTDALEGERAVPASRTANMNHLGGVAGATTQQQLAAMQAFILDMSTGVGTIDVLEAVFTEYDKFTNLLMKHSDFQPVLLNKLEGGLPIRFLNYQVSNSLFSCYSHLNTDEVTMELAEIGTMFYKPESHAAAQGAAPARRGAYFPIVEQDQLQNAIRDRTMGQNEVYWNTGANTDIASDRIQAIYCVAILDKRVWQAYAFQSKAIPFSSCLPKTTDEHTQTIRDKLALKRKSDELFAVESRKRIRSELTAETQAEKKHKALTDGKAIIEKPDPTPNE